MFTASTRLQPWPENLDLKRQSAEVPGTRKPGGTGEYRATFAEYDEIIKPGKPRTVYDLVERACQRNADLPLYQFRTLIHPATATAPAVWSPDLSTVTYAEAGRRRLNAGRAIQCLAQDGRLGPKDKQGNPTSAPPEILENADGFGVGIWSGNRPEWQITDFGAHAFSNVGVALYETLGPDVAEYIINHAPLSIVFAASHHVPTLLKLAHKCPSLRVIVSMDDLSDKENTILTAWGKSVHIEVLQMTQLEKWGEQEAQKRNLQIRPPRPESICTISYTSGTTGNPKGVVLTHSAVAAGTIAHTIGVGIADMNIQPRLLAYMPLAHIFERFSELLMMEADGCICYTTGDPLRLLEDAQIIKPHVMPSVPRVLNRIHQAIMAQAEGPGLKASMLKRAIETKIENFKKTGKVTHAFYDAVVFRKVRALLGGQIKSLSSGAAPISGEVLNTMRVCFSCDVVEGYGLTETVGTATAGCAFDPTHFGNIGPPRAGVVLMLRDVPELNYLSTDKPYPRGELLIRGAHTFSGYHKNPKATAEALDAEGWVHTGDVAAVDECGRFMIIDRIKNVIKLSQGEYVALEKVEGVYCLDPLFSTAMVYGDSFRSHLVLIGIVDPTRGAALVKQVLGKSVSPNDTAALKKYMDDPQIRKAVLLNLRALAKKNGLNGFETIKAVHLEIDPFPAEILTPTLKVKRQQATQYYRAAIDRMYDETPDAADPTRRAKL